MADTTNLPEGTDTIINGASAGGSAGSSGVGGGTSGGTGGGSLGGTGGGTSGGTGLAKSSSSTDTTDSLIHSSGSSGSDGSSKSGGVRGIVGSATGKIKDEAGTRARSFVSEGLERSSATLTNISTLVGDTVEQIEEKLGPQYGEYARTASETLTRYADTLSKKDPDELVDDARAVIRKSPGIALGAAAVVGFGLIRLIKAGIDGEPIGSRSTDARKNQDI
jgi:hypothetical protein